MRTALARGSKRSRDGQKTPEGLGRRTVAVVPLQSVTAADDHLREALQLARDLCMGISAFFVDPSGWVRVEPSGTAHNGPFTDRSRALARSCLEHADARGEAPFWSAEPAVAGQMPDESLACVVVPVRHEQKFLGLLGVIDDWLPDLDDEQLLGLAKIAEDLAVHLVAREAPAAAPRHPGLSATPASRPFAATGSPGGDREPEASRPPVADEERERPPAALGAQHRPEPVDAGGGGVTGANPAGPYEGFIGDVTEHLPAGLLVVRDDGVVILANHAMTRMTGLSRDEILGADIDWLLATETAGEGVAMASAALAALEQVRAPKPRFLLTTASEEPRPVHVDARDFSSPLGGSCRILILRDEPMERPVDTLLDALNEGIVLCDPQGAVILANAEAHRLSGLAPDAELVGYTYQTQIRLRTPDGSLLQPEVHPLLRALQGTEVPAEQVAVDDSHGERHQVIAAARPFPLASGIGALMTLRDVTLELRQEARLSHLALHDALTGVANRYLLDEHLRRSLRSSKARGGLIALIFFDLDDFKAVNDRYGHDAGDEVLAAVASRVQNTVRSTELVARIGGDEFVIACSSVSGPSDVELVVERLRKALAAPYQVGPHAIGVTASIGWVLADRHIETPETLLARADAEMYRSKRARPRPMPARS